MRSSLPNFLDTTEALIDFAQELWRRMSQAYVDIRLKQVKAIRISCPCGEGPMEWHSKSTWVHGTPFGDIVVEAESSIGESLTGWLS